MRLLVNRRKISGLRDALFALSRHRRCVAWGLMVAVASVTPLGSLSAEENDMVLQDVKALELNPDRLATNDHGPNLYKVRCTIKNTSLWIEGADTGYEWLTIVPYAKIDSIIYTESEKRWGMAKSILVGGLLFGPKISKDPMETKRWIVVHWKNKRDESNSAQLLLPKSGSLEFREELENRSGLTIRFESDDPKTVERDEHKTSESVRSPGNGKADEWLLEDLMSVSDFRRTGIGKLSSNEIQILEKWIDRYFKRREIPAQ